MGAQELRSFPSDKGGGQNYSAVSVLISFLINLSSTLSKFSVIAEIGTQLLRDAAEVGSSAERLLMSSFDKVPKVGQTVDAQMVGAAMQARDLLKDWKSNGSALGALTQIGHEIVPVFERKGSAHLPLESMRSGEFHSIDVIALDDLARTFGVYSESPAAKSLGTRTLDLRDAVASITNDGRRNVSIFDDRKSRPDAFLANGRVGDLVPGTRFKIIPNSQNVYEAGGHAQDGQVAFHHVDYSMQSELLPLPSNANVFASPTGQDVLSKHELAKGLSLAEYYTPFGKHELNPWSSAQQMKEGHSRMTDRGLDEYLKWLKAPIAELDTRGHVVLDVGAGAQQELARDSAQMWGNNVHGQERGIASIQMPLRSKIISIDPGLALSEEVDLGRIYMGMKKDYRLQGRRNPQPNTLPYSIEDCPLPDHSVHHAYALFSMPFWAKDGKQVRQGLDTVKRLVIPDGGNARFFPVRDPQLPYVENWLAINHLNLRTEADPMHISSPDSHNKDVYNFMHIKF
jgi:hypothetical protein